VAPEELPTFGWELDRTVFEDLLVAHHELGRMAGDLVVHELAEAPKHEPAGSQEPVDVCVERLAVVHRIELDLGLDQPNRRELLRGALKDVELRTLDVELQHVRGPEARSLGPSVESCELDRHILDLFDP
jgi:hypothetical protein